MRYKNPILILFFLLQVNSCVYANEISLEQWGREQAEKADTYTVGPEMLTDIEADISAEDKEWMKKQAENLKNLQPFDTKFLEDNDPNINNMETEILPQSELTSSKLLVFVSFSMPKESLQAWARQAKQADGALVLRGLVDNSLKKTLMEAHKTLGEQNLKLLLIDPLAFKKFKVSSVPAVVVAENIDEECIADDKCPIKNFDIVYGDVGLNYSLKKISGEGSQKELANKFLLLLEKKINVQ